MTGHIKNFPHHMAAINTCPARTSKRSLGSQSFSNVVRGAVATFPHCGDDTELEVHLSGHT